MGSAGGGGGGAGGGGGGSGGGGGGAEGRPGSYKFRDGVPIVANLDADEARNVLNAALRAMHKANPSYFDRVLCGAGVEAVVKGLFQLSAVLKSDDPKRELAEEFKLHDGPAVLQRVVDAIRKELVACEPDQRIREVLGRTVQVYLAALVKESFDALTSGNLAKIAKTLDQNLLSRLSGHFYWHHLSNVVKREVKPKQTAAELALKDACRGLADRMLDGFAKQEKPDYRRIVSWVRDHPEAILKEIQA